MRSRDINTDTDFSEILLKERFLIYDIYIKLKRVENHCVLGKIKQIYLLKFIIKLHI